MNERFMCNIFSVNLAVHTVTEYTCTCIYHTRPIKDTYQCDVLTRIYEKSTRTGDSKTQQNSNNCTAVASHFNKTAANDLFRG